MNITIIGGGNMGSALCKGFIKKGLVTADEVTVCDLNLEKLDALKSQLKIKTTTNLDEIPDSDVLILAVKPQGFEKLAQQLSGKVNKDTIVLSVMAATSIKKIQRLLEHQKVVRCMPNTPSLIGEGVLAWYADRSSGEEAKKTIQELLSCCGYAFEVDKEDDIDEVAYISGCGPGFFYYIMSQWQAACRKLSIDPEQSQDLLMKTISGSLSLAIRTKKDVKELQDNVTSKGGITAEGIKVLESAQLGDLFEEMMTAAKRRTHELSNE